MRNSINIQDMVGHTKDFIRHGADQPVHLIGHSYGGVTVGLACVKLFCW